jgi:ankyrin repeat protein
MLFDSARRLQAPVVALLIAAGADVNYLQNGWSALPMAIGQPQTSEPLADKVSEAMLATAKALLAAPALAQAAKDKALCEASTSCPLAVVRLLVEAGADPNAKDFGTPLGNAKSNPDHQVADYLRTHGAR